MPEPLRVTHVLLSLDVGGLERNVINQIRQGQKLGQDVSIVCIERPGALAPQALSLGATLACVHKPPGLRWDILAPLRNTFLGLRPDIIHTHQICPLLYTGLATLRMPGPIIVHTEHGRENYATRLRTRWLGRIGGHFAQRFFCLTQDMAAAVRAQRIVPAHKIRLIANGIDIDRFTEPADTAAIRLSLGIPLDAPLIGTVGRLTEIKRQDILLRAFATVHRHFPSAHLLLIGDGPLRQQLQQQAAELNLNGSVHFAGYQPHTAPYLQAMNIFALTSRSEGMPQSVLEASVARIPVIASNVGGLPEVIDHNRTGLLFPPGDDAALAESLRLLLSDPARADHLASAGKARVESVFGIARMARDYHREFLDILAHRAHAARLLPAASQTLPSSH